MDLSGLLRRQGHCGIRDGYEMEAVAVPEALKGFASVSPRMPDRYGSLDAYRAVVVAAAAAMQAVKQTPGMTAWIWS